MELLLKTLYLLIYSNLQKILTDIKIIIVFIIIYLVYVDFIQTKQPNVIFLNVITIKNLASNKYFNETKTVLNKIYHYYLYIKNKNYEDTDIIFSYIYLTQKNIPEKIKNLYFEIFVLKRLLLFLCFFQLLIINSTFEKNINQNIISCLIIIYILYLTYLSKIYTKTCIDFLTDRLKNKKELKNFLNFKQSLLTDDNYQFSKRKLGVMFRVICEPFLKQNPNFNFIKIKLTTPPINFKRFRNLILFLLFINIIFNILLHISLDDILIQNMSLLDTTQHSIYLSTGQQLHYKYVFNVYHENREIMQQYFFIEKSGFLKNTNGLDIKKHFLIYKNGYLNEGGVRQLFEFLKKG